jgi:hypothetical protein
MERLFSLFRKHLAVVAADAPRVARAVVGQTARLLCPSAIAEMAATTLVAMSVYKPMPYFTAHYPDW